MEYGLFVSGIGGQGVQLVCKTLALAATREQRHVMLAAEYGGQMRGGSSLGTVVIGKRRLRALPVVARAASAMALHYQFWMPVEQRLHSASLVVAEASIAERLQGAERHRVITVPALALATDAGNAMAAGMVLLGAYNAITGLVRNESLIEAMREQIPPYRRQHIAVNERALHAGAEAVPRNAAPVDLDAPQEQAA